MVTLKEIANRVGVSKSTVSRVINKTGLVNKTTEEKILKVIKELNYKPNEIARTLTNKRSNVIGIVVPKSSHNFFSLLVEKVDGYLAKHGYSLMIGNAQNDASTEERILDLLKRYLVDGIIVASHTADLTNFEDIDMPVVSFDRIISNKIPFIESNNYEGGRLATKHLIDKGCKYLVHVAGAVQLDSPANKRGEAFNDVCKEHNVACHTVNMGYRKFDFQDNFDLMDELFKKHPDVDGIFASNDALGISAIKLAQLHGKHVPNDVQIIGYDDVEIARLSNPELTTIRQSIDDIAKALVDAIVGQIKKETVKQHQVIPVSLIERGSTL